LQQVNIEQRIQLAQSFHRGIDMPQNLDAAEAIYNEILNHATTHPFVEYCLATLHMERGNIGLAIVLFHDALKGDPTFAECWNNLGMCLSFAQHPQASDKAYARALELQPENADILSNRAGLRINAGRATEALDFANSAVRHKPEHRQARFHKALALLELGRWSEAWDWHESRLEPPDSNDGIQAGVALRNYSGDPEKPTPWWDGKSPGRVVCHGEEGLGDEIMFASCIPDALARGVELIFEPNPRLERLMARSFPDVHVRGTHYLDGREWTEEIGEPDFKLACGSLPKFFRRAAKDFPRTPYLKADAARTNEIFQTHGALSGKPRIGIAWEGGVNSTHVHLRSMNLTALEPILQHDVHWVSLQYTPDAARNAAAYTEQTGIEIHHWPDIVSAPADLDEMAALVSGLDLVITVCQTALHLCGGLGVPCWVMTPSKPAWRYGLTAPTMAWYGDWVKLYRQKTTNLWTKDDDWSEVVAQIADDLTTLLSERRAA
tara:strand:+ start:7886 stop:9361 length:1476 start_codon:yes stop_codon:yes gene_type:complete